LIATYVVALHSAVVVMWYSIHILVGVWLILDNITWKRAGGITPSDIFFFLAQNDIWRYSGPTSVHSKGLLMIH